MKKHICVFVLIIIILLIDCALSILTFFDGKDWDKYVATVIAITGAGSTLIPLIFKTDKVIEVEKKQEAKPEEIL